MAIILGISEIYMASMYVYTRFIHV